MATCLAATALLPIAATAPPAQAAIRTWYADLSYAGTSPDGSAAKPFNTLALVNGAAYGAGDTLVFEPGQTWVGQLKVTKAITVDRDGAGALPTFTQSASGPCIDVVAAGATIKNVRATACATDGVRLQSADQTVTDVVAEGNPATSTAGVRVNTNAANATITGGSFSNNYRGVLVYASATIKSSTITGNAQDGVWIGGSDTEVAWTTFADNDTAVTVTNAQDVDVHHNLSTNDVSFAKVSSSIATDATTGVTFEYNEQSSSETSARFVTLTTSNGTSLTGTRVRNNTTYLPLSTGKAVVCPSICTNAMLDLRGNVLWSGGAQLTAGGATGAYNVFGGSGTPVTSGTTPYSLGTGEVKADPLFVDPAGGDFRLAADSPAIDRVAVLPAAPFRAVDRDGVLVRNASTAFVDGDIADGGEDADLDAGAYEALKPALRGLVSILKPGASNNPAIHGDFATIKVDWRDLETADQTFNWDLIDAILGAHDGVGDGFVQFRIRIMAGRDAPTWGSIMGAAVDGVNPDFPNDPTKQNNCAANGGGISVYPDSANGNRGCVPLFWNAASSYRTEYTELMTALAGRYKYDAQVVDVVNSACSTVFAESFILGAEDDELGSPATTTTSVDRLGGATPALTATSHEACVKDTTAQMATVFPTTRITVAGHDTWQYLVPDASGGFKVVRTGANGDIIGDWGEEERVLDTLRATYGGHLVLEDHSLKGASDEVCSGTNPWFCYLAAMGESEPHGWQFTTGSGDWMPTATNHGIDLGSCYLEAGAGFGRLATSTDPTLDGAHASLMANCDGRP